MNEIQTKILKTIQDHFCDLPEEQFKRETAAIFDCLYDELELNAAPTSEQVKNLIRMLPLNILVNVADWGFNDTVVREKIHLVVRNNKEKFSKKL